MSEEVEILVLGAGMTGLCAAHYLVKAHGAENVLVLEAADAVGGTARTDHVDGFSCDWGPNGFLDKEPLTLEWVRELGLADQVVRANEASAHRFVMRNGRLHEVKPPPAFLLSSLLSISGRARLLCEPLIRQKRDNTVETIWDFAARRIGREAADILVGPMVSGIYGGDAKQLSLEHCFPRMAEMERTHGSLFKALLAKRRENKGASPMGPSGVLTSLEQGIGGLPIAAAGQLNDRVRTCCPAVALRRRRDRYEVETKDGNTIVAQCVVVATPTFTAADLTKELDESLAEALAAIEYASIAVLCTAYRREDVGDALDGFGFLVPRTEGKRALGCIWTSTIFPNHVPDGYVMLRTMYGGFTDPEAVSLTDNELIDWLKQEIHPLLRIETDPAFTRIYRHKRGIPQYLMGHGAHLEAIEAAERRYPGLVFAGNGYQGVSLNDCVLSAHRAVNAVGALRPA